MIRITPLTAPALRAYLESAEYARSPVVPITPLRAQAQLANPRRHPDDVLLLLAHADEQLVGYLGVLPDTVYLASGEARHCGWLSCLWVSPAHRGQRIAQQLLERAFEAWNQQIIITEYTAPAEQLYRKLGSFRDLTTKAGIRLYLRADLATLLPPKRPLFGRVRPLLRVLDRVANAVLALRGRRAGAGPALEYIRAIDAEAADFIAQRQGHELTRRGLAELNWLLHHPWLRSAPAPDADGRRYHFSSVANPFAFYALKVRDVAGSLAAVLVLARRDNALKMPYCYHTGNVKLVAEVVFGLLQEWGIATFTTFEPTLVQLLSTQATPALLKRPMLRKYMVATALAGLPAQVQLQDGDGDASFT